MKTRRKLILLFLLFVVTCDVSAQVFQAVNPTLETKFRKISVEQGLSQSTVFCIHQDRLGFMWYGTRGGGLNRYNGYEFTIYKNIPNDPFSLNDNEVLAIDEDLAGNMWVGTRNGGINKLDGVTGKFSQYPVGKAATSYTANTFHIDASDKIWVGTNLGLLISNKEKSSFNRILPVKKTGAISSIQADRNGYILTSSREKLCCYSPKEKRLWMYSFQKSAIDKTVYDINVPLLLDRDHLIWVGSVEGLMVFTWDKQNGFVRSLKYEGFCKMFASGVNFLQQDSKGFLWVGTVNGLYKCDLHLNKYWFFRHEENNPSSLSYVSVYSFLEDRDANIWVGTWGGGVNFLTLKNTKFDHYAHQIHNKTSLSDDFVSSFAENKEGIWVGTEQGGVNLFNPTEKSFKSFLLDVHEPGTSDINMVKALLVDSKGQLWAGSRFGGLFRFDSNTRCFIRVIPGLNVFSLCENQDHQIWVGTIDGLYQINLQGQILNTFRHNAKNPSSISNKLITCLFSDSHNQLWIGTKGDGLYQYQPERKNFVRLVNDPRNKRSLSNNFVLSIGEDLNGRIWIGTPKGLNRYDSLKHDFTAYVELNHLSDNNINGILHDKDNNLWLSTNKGISRLNPKSLQVSNYDVNDGLQNIEFLRNSCFRSQAGQLFFGGINGFVCFYPRNIVRNTKVPQILVTDFSIAYKKMLPNEPGSPLTVPMTRTTEIRLKHTENSFSFGFLVLNYVNSEKNQYACKLEGYDKEWVSLGKSRTMSYMNMAPGNYVFRVRGSNNDNVWNEQGKAIRILILPPFWKTWMAFLLYLLLFGLLFILVKNIIQSRIRQQNLLENERLDKKRMEELNNVKLQFFTNISHEFRTSLTLISTPLEKLQTSNTDKDRSYYGHIVGRNVHRLLRLINQLMDFNKMENNRFTLSVKPGSFQLFLENIASCFEEQANSKQIQWKVTGEEDSETWFDPDILEKVLFNILSNAFKFTDPGGQIELRWKMEDGMVFLVLQDSGIGIPPDKLKRIFERFYSSGSSSQELNTGTGIGLALTKSLVELHHGQIRVESQWTVGTTFYLSIPILMSAYQQKERVENPDKQPMNASNWNIESHVPQQFESVNTPSQSEPIIVLIVEDNEDLRNFLLHHLSEKYSVQGVANGEEALNIVQDLLPDLIVSDIMMPVMDGIALCREIKSNFVTSHIPVLLLTAYTEMEKKIMGLQTGADAYIEKPFDIRHLDVQIENLINQRQLLKQAFSHDRIAELANSRIPAQHLEFLKNVSELIAENRTNPDFSVEEFSKQMNLSRSQLFRKFKTVCDTTPWDFLCTERLKFAMELLQQNSDLNVTDVAYQSGFSSSNYFITSFKNHTGMTPKEYSQKMRSLQK